MHLSNENPTVNCGITNATVDEEVVFVTAADYNGSTFDGSPFSKIPEWLMEAILTKKITVYPDTRDYACWKVLTPKGEVIALPGDLIIRRLPSLELMVYTNKIGRE